MKYYIAREYSLNEGDYSKWEKWTRLRSWTKFIDKNPDKNILRFYKDFLKTLICTASRKQMGNTWAEISISVRILWFDPNICFLENSETEKNEGKKFTERSFSNCDLTDESAFLL